MLAQVDETSTVVPITKGRIEFKNVHFHYPTRPEAEVLTGLNLTIEAGQTVAIVGGSGSGKTTILGLLQKMYKADAGEILVDGVNLVDMSTPGFLDQIAVVPQEPKLFNLTVSDNIGYRLLGDPALQASRIEEAAKMAFAHDFIRKFEGGYLYPAGKFGDRLSGGQRQRVAIARALLEQERVRIM